MNNPMDDLKKYSILHATTDDGNERFEIDLYDDNINPMKVALETSSRYGKLTWFLDAPHMTNHHGKVALVTFKSGTYQKFMPF